MTDHGLTLRLLSIVCWTLVGGGLCGVADAFGKAVSGKVTGTIILNVPLGFLFGALIGFVASTFTMPLLWRKSLSAALPMVFAPALIAAFLAGRHFGNDPWSAPISVGTLLIACAIVWYFMPDLYPVRRPGWQHRCRSCGYDLRGLPGKACPECGQKAA